MLFIFDMDNVLYDYHWRDRMASLTEVTGMDFHELRRRWWHDEGEWQAEAGNPDTGDEYIARVNEAFGSAITRQEWVEMRKQAMVFRPEVAEAAAFAKSVDIPVLAAIPQDDDLRKKSANYQIVGTAQSQWGALFAELADAVSIAPPVRPSPLDQDGLLNLFDSKDTGGDYVLVPATDIDMRGKNAEPKESLEVVYDEA